jgi:hypothetical protein
MENNCKIECNEQQLRLIQRALDFYSRCGMGQFTEIKNHPTFENSVLRLTSPKTPLKVGDRTMRGEITKITKTAIWTKGTWGNGEEIKKWTDLENIHHSPDWEQYHGIREEVDRQLNVARNLLYGEDMGVNGSWGIYNSKVDESCREAYSLVQHIRHQFWLADPQRSDITVDSSVDSRACPNVKVSYEKII